MRATFISVVSVLAVSLFICIASMLTIDRAVYEMEDYCMRAIDAADAGDLDGAEQLMVGMATVWTHYTPYLEIISPHHDLHSVKELYVEAAINLQREHFDDYHKSMALLEEALLRLREEESLSLSNIL